MAFFEKIKAVMDITFDSEYQCFEIKCILTFVAILFFEKLINEFEALAVFLTYEKDMDEPIRLLPLIKRLILLINKDWLTIYKHCGLLWEASFVNVTLRKFYFSFLFPFFG